MADLQALQNRMTAAILGGDMANVAEELLAGTADPGRRLRIYRNNTFASLTECLKATFPVTVRLADERFFAYAAHQFIAAHPPREARLSAYGGEFPRFLAAFPPAREFPIIAEMASLEWAIAACLNDTEEPPVPMSVLELAEVGSGAAGLCLQPNLRFAMARWPLIGVWSSHKRETVAIDGPLARKLSRIAVSHNGEDIQLLELDAARFAFWRALHRGLSLALAAERALARDRLFDPVGETVILFRSRLVTGVFTPLNQC